MADPLAAAEQDIADAVAAALADTADEYGRALNGATELVAARFSVGRIAGMWARRVPALVRRLLGVAETAAQQTATDVDAELPDGWTDLPARHQDGRRLPDGIGRYATATEALLNAVGDRLADAAVRELAAGLNRDESVDQLRARLLEAFARDGAQLGPGREQRIAQTEAVRAWNTAVLAAARDLTTPDRPLVKQWLTRNDSSVRSAHRAAAGQLRLLDEPFRVAGTSMQAPGDPSAPPALTVNCRCRLAIAPEPRTASLESHAAPSAACSDPRESRVDKTAASSAHTGAMIALAPTVEDAQRLALDSPGAEPAGELHLTLFYLGEASDWDEEHRADLLQRLTDRAQDLLPLTGQAFGANQWNANGDEPCWVWAVGDDRDTDGPGLETTRAAAVNALEDQLRQPQLPAQHSPWQPHVCAAYSRSPALLTAMNERLGPVRFDRLRVAFAGEYTDIPLGPPTQEDPMDNDQHNQPQHLAARRWSTPGDAGLAFENQQTGDGRVFRAGALYWDGAGPWPLQYAEEMLTGHEGAELAGAIELLERDDYRLASNGVLYPGRPAGADALMLLEEGAPLGVSVDLDNVTVEFVDTTGRAVGDPDDEVVLLAAALPSASFLRLADGSWAVTATATAGWTASGQVMSRTAAGAQIITGPDGRIPATAVQAAFGPTGTLTAGAGAPDPEDGIVLHSESAGDLLMRVTRARVRGATLVSVPAFDQARIVLDPQPGTEPVADPQGNDQGRDDEEMTAAAAGTLLRRVVDYVTTAPHPVGARDTGQALDITMTSARGALNRAAAKELIVRLARGLYVGNPSLGEDKTRTAAPVTAPLTAAVSGDLDLPVLPERDAEWDGDKAASRILAWATDEDGNVDADKLSQGFLYRDDTANPATVSAYKLPFADAITRGDTQHLEIIDTAVYTIANVLQGGMGGVDLPDDDREAIRGRVEELYARLAGEFDDDSIAPPWADDKNTSDDQPDDSGEEQASAALVASAWTAMREAPPMPAEWFREPTAAELPPGSGGVHVDGGRIYGWVAQVGEPHAGMPGRNLTIESLGDIDLSHFNRAHFKLDDGSVVRAGAMTMNAGHHNDGATCETSACQFDDTRTVAGIVRVGQNDRGLWFSGAAAPWLDTWDDLTFRACQPSYHMIQGRDGRWQLRAVLSVPVPGHSSPLLAAFAERSNLALTAASTAPTPDDSPISTAQRRQIGEITATLATINDQISGLRDQIAALNQPPAPAPTGDPVQDEINALAARVELAASAAPTRERP